MKTRTSPRNQERLFRYLFCTDPKPQPTPEQEQTHCCSNCASYPRGGRMYAICRGYRKGERVAGSTIDSCFAPRQPNKKAEGLR